MSIPTVKIEAASERGWRIINEADFDPKRHKLFAEKAEKPEKAEAPKGKGSK
jgi:hypothetical protein